MEKEMEFIPENHNLKKEFEGEEGFEITKKLICSIVDELKEEDIIDIKLNKVKPEGLKSENINKERVIRINLNDFKCSDKDVSAFRFQKEGDKEGDPLLKIINVDMASIKEKCANKPIKELTMLELFVLGITSDNIDYIKELAKEHDIMSKFLTIIEKLNEDSEIRKEYNKERGAE